MKRVIASFILFLGLMLSAYSLLGGERFDISQELKTQDASLQSKEGWGEKIIIRPKIAFTASDLKDPFEEDYPPIQGKTGTPIIVDTKPVPLPALEVQGMIWGSNTPQAIINEKIVKIGDVIKEVEIVDISKEGVTVLFRGRIYKLSPPSSVPKEKPAR